MIITLLVYNIQWDTEEESDIEAVKHLPEKMEVEVDLSDQEGWTELNHQICNQLSDETGWCVLGYELKGYDSMLKSKQA